MGAAKDMWMDEVEQIGEQFCNGDLTRDEAMRELERKGFGTQEARDMLDAVIA
jgi:hypothetical protein